MRIISLAGYQRKKMEAVPHYPEYFEYLQNIFDAHFDCVHFDNFVLSARYIQKIMQKSRRYKIIKMFGIKMRIAIVSKNFESFRMMGKRTFLIRKFEMQEQSANQNVTGNV